MDGVARFAIVGPHGDPELAEVAPPRATSARDADCSVVLNGIDISQLHCRLERLESGRHRLIDLAGRNELLVNGRPVAQADLQPFDRVRLGGFDLVYLDANADSEKVLEILSVNADDGTPESTLRPPRESPLRERLLWLILMVQELRDEEDLGPLLDSLLDELLRATAFERAIVLLLDDGTPPALASVKLRNAPPDHVRSDALAPYHALVTRALEEDAVLEAVSPLVPTGLTVCVPLRSHQRAQTERRHSHAGSLRGALLLGKPDAGSLPPDALRLLKALARQIAVLLSSARLQREATTDGLTSLANRAHTTRLLYDEVQRARAAGSPLAVLILDLDDFKAINDQHGHAVGDEVLREAALRLRRGLRLTDSAGRWGGEEFLAILPGADAAGGLAVANKLLEDLRAAPVSSKHLTVTASVGVAALSDHADPTGLVACADVALYEAKANGKNCAVAFAPALETETASETRRLRVAQSGRMTRRPVAWLLSDTLAPVPLSPGETTLGRDFDNAVVLVDPSVSRRHGVLTASNDGAARYQDCSRHGSKKNGAPVAGEVELVAGDRLGIGPYEFRFSAERGDVSLAETGPLPRLSADSAADGPATAERGSGLT